MGEQDKVNEEVFGTESTETPKVEITPDDIEGPEELSEIEKVIFDKETDESAKVTDPAQTDTPTEEQDEGFFQTSYQKTMEALERHDPALKQTIKQELKEERTTAQEAFQPEQPATEDYADDPMKAIAEMRQMLTDMPKVLRGEVARVQEESALKQQYQDEYVNADNALRGFVAENKISQEVLEAAYKEASSYGIDVKQVGGPTGMVKLIVNKLRTDAVLAHASNKGIAAQAEGEAKGIAANLVAQPAPGAMPEPAPKTRNEKLLDAMQSAGTNEANAEVFGT